MYVGHGEMQIIHSSFAATRIKQYDASDASSQRLGINATEVTLLGHLLVVAAAKAEDLQTDWRINKCSLIVDNSLESYT